MQPVQTVRPEIADYERFLFGLLAAVDIKSSNPLCFDAMRTTLTLDDDVAVVLERLRRRRQASLKNLINEALRRGLKDMDNRPTPRAPVRTRAVALGGLRIVSIDNIGDALAIAEGEPFK